MREVNRVVLIGLGGIGSALDEHLCRYLQFTVAAEQDDPPVIVLADGDFYEPKNLERQNMSWDHVKMNKAEARAKELCATFDMLDVEVVPEYVTEANIKDVVKDGDVVFVGVDNFKTRKIIANHCDTLNDVIVISGGNELTDGNVQLFIKEGGEKRTANLTEYHPEIADAKDKTPDEMGCEELMHVQPQLLFMNLQIATLMLVTFYNVMIAEKLSDVEFGEVYTDIKMVKTLPAERIPVD